MPTTMWLSTVPDAPLEAEVLSPDRLAGRSRREIEGLEVWHGNRRVRLGEVLHRVGIR